jgi:signal transduction histidine kinase
VARARTHAASRGVTVTSRGGAASPPLRADIAGVVSALEALLLNAIDASAEGDEVSLSATWHPAARELHLVVTDHGEGIPPERAPNVARAFYSTRQAPGVGISVARSVAAAHGGEVSLCCPPEGGTVATLRLSAGAFAAR